MYQQTMIAVLVGWKAAGVVSWAVKMAELGRWTWVEQCIWPWESLEYLGWRGRVAQAGLAEH